MSQTSRTNVQSTSTELVEASIAGADDIGSSASPVTLEIGQWYWVKSEELEWDEQTQSHRTVEFEWLGCAVHIGSNYVGLEGPYGSRSSYSVRVHFDDFWTTLRAEPNPEAVIRAKVEHYQAIASRHMAEVRAITARLGVSTQAKLGEERASPSDNALMVLSGQNHLEDYKRALIVAQKKELPALFEAIKDANGQVTAWMTASALPMEAMAKGMQGTVDEIKDRIFNVSLYAGLLENVVKCRDGEAAPFHEKLRVMQRMFFMDEECLLNYRHGGMSFQHIEQFDAWLAQDDNLARVMPFPRCLIAMRVRRTKQEREWDGSLRSLFINIELGVADMATFLYIRNGEQLYRLSTELEFGERIFPDRSVFDPGRPMMVKMFASSVDKIISRDEYDQCTAEEMARRARAQEWNKANPEAEWCKANPGKDYEYGNPHRSFSPFKPDEWSPFDPSNVYFDDIAEKFGKEMKQHNRIALIIQGLFDRSEVLHPHPPVKVWSPTSFAASIELIYDGSAVLHSGEAPDFEAYRQRCNASLGTDCVVIGQELYWMEREAEKECRRRDKDYRDRSGYRPKVFRPHRDPGPGYLARMAEWKPRARVAKFTWKRQRQVRSWRDDDEVFTSITVPADRIFNVSAYRPGDYLQFFQDSRTRAEYLKWAPLLLAAEEYHAGSSRAELTVQDPAME